MAYAIWWTECLIIVFINQAFLVEIVRGNKPMWTIGMIGSSTFITICLQK